MLKRLLPLLAIILILPLTASPARAQTPFPREEMQELINAARLANGAGMLAWNEDLAEAAQRHAEDIATRPELGHTGSDGSTPEDRAARVGYLPYPDGMRVSENWSTGTAMDVMAFFLNDQVHRDNMLMSIWREVGVGTAATANGGELWVVLFGAQPGVLPIFVNQDEPRTVEQTVTVQLSTEEAGWDEATFTAPVEVRVGEPETIEAAAWQPWQAEVTLELTEEGGEKTVIVEYRDAGGRVVRSEDTVFYVAPEGPVPTSEAAQLAPTLTPSHT
ncbi:MAG TPA: CAP domain-containing protein, partial [Ardenticatenaceae bacterium]